MKTFEMGSLFFCVKPEIFTEDFPPDWLSSVNTVKGSTMDQRWFYNEHVLTLDVGQSVDTDFTRIKRLS